MGYETGFVLQDLSLCVVFGATDPAASDHVLVRGLFDYIPDLVFGHELKLVIDCLLPFKPVRPVH